MTKKATEYDIIKAYQEMEEYLIASMCRNLYKHIDENNDYTMWQAEQLKQLALYRKTNAELFGKKYRKTINKDIEKVLQMAYKKGYQGAEVQILKDIKDNKVKDGKSKGTEIKLNSNANAQFFGVNDSKLRALIKATTDDMDKVTVATLRNADDQYRKIIYNTQVALNSGTLTLDQAVKQATNEFLQHGINSIQYQNGARVNIASYSEMALRTANKRAKLQGEGKQRQDIGINTVLVVRSGNACPKCAPFLGRVYIDDVWSGGSLMDAIQGTPYPMLSEAIKQGLYHPNCRDTHVTYMEGITSIPKPLTPQEKAEQQKKYDLEQQQRYLERQLRKNKRLRDNAMLEADKEMYDKRVKAYSKKINDLVKAYPNWLRRKPNRESIYGITKLTPPVIPIKPITPKKKPVVPKTPVPTINPTTVTMTKPSVNMDVMLNYRGGKKHKEKMIDIMVRDEVPQIARDVWNKYGDDLDTYKGRDGAHYSPYYKAVYMKINSVAKGNYFSKPYETAFHEFGHNIDNLAYKDMIKVPREKIEFGHVSTDYKNGAYSKMIKQEAQESVINYAVDNIEKITDYVMNNVPYARACDFRDIIEAEFDKNNAIESMRTLLYDDDKGSDFVKRWVLRSMADELKRELTGIQRSDISDIFEGSRMTDNVDGYFLGFGHGVNYWKSHDVCVEAFAEMFSATCCNTESLEQIKRFFPKSYDLFLEILDYIAKSL